MDRALRELERTWRRTGALEDEVALLRHRVRVGDLAPGWLEAAARLGHEGARRALGRFVPVFGAEALVVEADRLGPGALGRAMATAAAAGGAAWDATRPHDDLLARGLALAARLRGEDQASSGRARVGGAGAGDGASDRLPGPDDVAGLRAEALDLARALAEAAEALDEVARAARWDDPADVLLDVEARRALDPAALREVLADLATHRSEQDRRADGARAAARAAARARAALLLAAAPPTTAAERALAGLDVAGLLAQLDDAAVRAVRAGLAAWALEAPVGPAPTWPVPPAHDVQAARRADEEAWRAAQGSKASRAEATALRRALRDKAIDRARVALLADLGLPAAWLVERREGAPDLSSPASGLEVGRRFDVAFARHVVAEPARARRRAWIEDDGTSTRGALYLRALGEPRWPAWVRAGATRLALAVAGPARGAQDDRAVGAAWALAEDLYRAPDAAKAVAAREAAQALARRDGATAARSLVAAAVALVAEIQAGADPRLDASLLGPRSEGLFTAACALEPPGALWERARAALVAWALGRDVLAPGPSGARAYDPAGAWAVGELLAHPRFGEGRVERVEPGKVTVAFADGARTLRAGR